MYSNIQLMIDKKSKKNYIKILRLFNFGQRTRCMRSVLECHSRWWDAQSIRSARLGEMIRDKHIGSEKLLGYIELHLTVVLLRYMHRIGIFSRILGRQSQVL